MLSTHLGPWSRMKPESQLDFYGDVQLEFLNHQHVRLTTCVIPGKCIDAEQLAEIAFPGRSTGIKISLVEVDESLPRLFVLGGRNLHGALYGEGWGAPRVCLVPIPSMRIEGQSLEPVNTEVENKKLVDNFRTSTDAVLFSGCEAVNVDCHGRSSGLKIMTSFWSLWKMFCDFLSRIKQDGEQRAVAILPDDQNILDDVRMGGFKHQFQLLSRSCAFGMAMPDGRMLSEKMILRSQKRSEFKISTRIHVRNMFMPVTAVLGESTIQDSEKLFRISLRSLMYLECLLITTILRKVNPRNAHVLLG